VIVMMIDTVLWIAGLPAVLLLFVVIMRALIYLGLID
jgi:hypothetical protein